MKKKTVIALATLLACGQGAWADETKSFPLHYDAVNNPENGSEAHPYQIQSVSDLNALASDVNSGTDYKDTYFKLTADLDYSGVALSDTDEDGVADSNFTPIGYGDESDGKSFKGVFDGNGHYIKGITVNTPSAMGVALFGYIYNPAEIRNLTLKDCSFTGNFEVGAIAGSSYGSATNSKFGIYGCTVESSVKVTAVSATIDSENYPGTYAGGIIGYCGSLTVSGCTSAAEVKGDESVGGIAGHIMGSTLGGVIEDCFFTGSVQGGSEATEVGNIVGGRGPMDEEEGTDGTLKLTLIDTDGDADINNAARLGYYKDVANVDITISGRTLYKDGSWNTLCLPFAMDATQIAASDLAGATIKELNTETSNLNPADGTLTLNFTTAYDPTDAPSGSIVAGRPYIVKWATTGDNISNPVFLGITISSTAPTAVEFAIEGSSDKCQFVGQYSPFSIVASGATGSDQGNVNEIIMLGSGSKLGYSQNARTLNCFRAHFYVPADPVTGQQNARRFVMDFGNGENTTGILTVTADTSATTAGIYTLDGRRLQAEPTEKGVYIVNGKKTIIK